MKEITSTSANFLAQIPDAGEKFYAQVEVCLVLSEVTYKHGVTGDLHKDRTCETVRFSITAENLRKMAKHFTRYADEAETALSEALREHRSTPPPAPSAPAPSV